MSPYKHSESSVRKFGGKIEDYLLVHEFLDSTKLHFTGFQHRAILHNTFGIGLCEKIFGPVIRNSEGKDIEVRYIAMEHIKEDLGFIPTIKDWVMKISSEDWMRKKPEPIVTKGNLFKRDDEIYD